MSESPYTTPKARVDPPLSSERPALERPKEVLIAIWLLIAGIVIGWAGTVVTWDYQLSVQSLGQLLLGQVFGLAIAGWIYYKIYCGRNWARILFLVMFILGLVGLLAVVVTDILPAMPTATNIVTVVGQLLNAAIVWLLFFSPGRHWFSKR